MSKARAIGTAAETAVVKAARIRGFPWADRTALHGALDIGDLTLCPGVYVQVKGGEYARAASDTLIESWLDQTERQRINARAEVAFLVVQRPGVGLANAHRWSAWWRLSWLMQVIPNAGIPSDLYRQPMRLTLHDSLDILRAAGYGAPPEQPWDEL